MLPPEIRTALDNLDQTLNQRSAIEAAKDARITTIRGRLAGTTGDRETYKIYDDLFNEYNKYNLDSAIVYANKKMLCAQRCGDRTLIFDGLLDLVDRYNLSGMYYSAAELLEKADTTGGITLWQRHSYYLSKQTIFEGLAQTSKDSNLREQYLCESRKYRNLRYDASEKNWLTSVYAGSDILMEQKDFNGALEILTGALKKKDLPQKDQAILHYLMANCYKQAGNRENAILHYAISADYDLRTPNNEYRSLCILATLMYENGEIDRAYRYINRSFEDALAANSRYSLDYVSDALPVITSSYEQLIRSKNQIMNSLLLALGLLVITLVALLSVIYRDRKQLWKANREIRDNYEEIQRINVRLERYIARLKEANAVKDSYLGRYMDLFSDHISSLEKYRSQLRVVAKTRDFSEIMTALKSDEYIESELSHFYERFDATFLGLYPHFVEQLNLLIKPDRQLAIPQKEWMLTTEQRVFALIRLGITDSTQIARFLRKSVSTVYNYRVKLRNAALNERDDFEKAVMSIGKPVLISSNGNKGNTTQA